MTGLDFDEPWQELDIGIVHDSALNARNDLRIFTEGWVGLLVVPGLSTGDCRRLMGFTVDDLPDAAELAARIMESDGAVMAAIARPDEPGWRDAMRVDASSQAAAEEMAAWNRLLHPERHDG